MNIMSELEEIKTMRDLGDAVEIKTSIRSHEIPKGKLRFSRADELQRPFLQNSGANTIWCTNWVMFQDMLKKFSIILPEEVSPCKTCKGNECMFWCTKTAKN